MPAPPDLLTLRLFLAAHETRNLTRAAERCALAPSAATRRLQALEARYGGAPLFERGARGLAPTPIGDALARRAAALLALAERTDAELREFAGGARGRVRLHASTSAIVQFLADELAAFGAENPSIEVELHEELSRAIVRDVLEGRADLGVVSTGVEVPAGLQAEPWRDDRLLAVVPAGHPLARRRSVRFEELLDFEHIGIGETRALSLQLAEAAARLHRSIRHAQRMATTEAGRRLVAAGHGVAVLPDGMVRPFEATMGLRGVPLADEWGRRRHRLVLREEAGLPAPARRLLDHLRRRHRPGG
jgi:DNA-binding transcriptional LysR family regulator